MSEQQIQTDFFSWLSVLEARFPELGLFYAIPNGSHKSFTARMVHQATGLKSGVPDTHLPLAMNGTRGLWIEFKSKTGKLSENQERWITMLRCAGHRVEVCRSWIAAANVVIEYLQLPLEKIAPEV